MLNNFAIFKNEKKENEKQPDYKISAKVGEEYQDIGGCWIKEGKSGKFFSCKLNAQYQNRPGYEINEVKIEEPVVGGGGAVLMGPVNSTTYPTDDIDADSIPF